MRDRRSSSTVRPSSSRLAQESYGMSTAVDTVEAEVRELVRRRGLDPIVDQPAMHRLVDEVVSDYDERALTSSLPPLPDPRSAARAVYDAVAGFGPLERHLDDEPSRRLALRLRRAEGGMSSAVSVAGRD
jgi:hypothetical protein